MPFSLDLLFLFFLTPTYFTHYEDEIKPVNLDSFIHFREGLSKELPPGDQKKAILISLTLDFQINSTMLFAWKKRHMWEIFLTEHPWLPIIFSK